MMRTVTAAPMATFLCILKRRDSIACCKITTTVGRKESKRAMPCLEGYQDLIKDYYHQVRKPQTPPGAIYSTVIAIAGVIQMINILQVRDLFRLLLLRQSAWTKTASFSSVTIRDTIISSFFSPYSSFARFTSLYLLPSSTTAFFLSLYISCSFWSPSSPYFCCTLHSSFFILLLLLTAATVLPSWHQKSYYQRICYFFSCNRQRSSVTDAVSLLSGFTTNAASCNEDKPVTGSEDHRLLLLSLLLAQQHRDGNDDYSYQGSERNNEKLRNSNSMVTMISTANSKNSVNPITIISKTSTPTATTTETTPSRTAAGCNSSVVSTLSPCFFISREEYVKRKFTQTNYLPLSNGDSNILYREIKLGSGDRIAQPNDFVRVHLIGRRASNSDVLVENTYQTLFLPRRFIIGNSNGIVIKGVDEGIRGMKVGGRRELIIPQYLGFPLIDDALIYEIELLQIADADQLYCLTFYERTIYFLLNLFRNYGFHRRGPNIQSNKTPVSNKEQLYTFGLA